MLDCLVELGAEGRRPIGCKPSPTTQTALLLAKPMEAFRLTSLRPIYQPDDVRHQELEIGAPEPLAVKLSI